MERQGISIAPGDLVFIRYLDLKGGPTAMYQVIAVYDHEEFMDIKIPPQQRFYYFRVGADLRICDAPVSILEERSLEVTVHRL